MKRSGPLRRLTPLRSLTPLRKQSRKQRKRNDQWSKVTRQAIRLVNGVCPVRGEACEHRATVGHHKLARSQGGPDTLENCLPCCPICHIVTVHGNPTKSVKEGWIIMLSKNPEEEEDDTGDRWDAQS